MTDPEERVAITAAEGCGVGGRRAHALDAEVRP